MAVAAAPGSYPGLMLVIIVVAVVVVVGVLIALLAVNRGKAAFADAHAAARQLAADGDGPHDLGRVLLEDHKLPAGQAIAIVSDVTGCTPREAIEVLRPHLNESLQKTYDDMTDERLETSKARLLH